MWMLLWGDRLKNNRRVVVRVGGRRLSGGELGV